MSEPAAHPASSAAQTEHFDVLLEDKGELPWGVPPRQPAEKAAREIVQAIQRNRHEIVTGWRGWFWLLLNRLSPRLVDRLLNRYG